MGYVPFALMCAVATTSMAWLSWHLVEKRALRLKRLEWSMVSPWGSKAPAEETAG